MAESRIIAIASQKGGVGKTTSTISIGAELAATGHKVLLVDLDPQGHLSEGLGFSAGDFERELSQVLLRKATLDDIIVLVRDNLDLAPSNINLAYVETELFSQLGRENRLKSALGAIQRRYDVVLIDCPPSLGIFTVNALAAAKEVLIPMSVEFYSLYGVDLLLKSIAGIKREINSDITVLGILPTRMNRTIHATDVLNQAKTNWPDLKVFEPAIPDLVAVRNAAAAGKPLCEYDPESPATAAYHTIAKEL